MTSLIQFLPYLLDVINEKGLEHVTVDDLVAEITPKGRGESYHPLLQFACIHKLLTSAHSRR